jgi:hypothetical protein
MKAVQTPSKRRTAMNKFSMLKFRASIFAVVLAVAPLSPASNAQDAGVIGRMNVPFAFETSSQHFPAGVYTIRMEDQHLVRIRGTSVAGIAVALVEDNGAPAKRGVAVFQRYGDRYFLNEISITGKSGLLFLRPSKEETQLQIAASKTASTGLQIALSTPR